MVVTARAVGLGAPVAAGGRRLVMDGELAIAVRRERGVVIVAVSGDIDIFTVTVCGNAYPGWRTAGRR